ncbi:MAG: hypothetical protein JSR31_07650 [Nitrospira sp.]|nr:hypothetical protein [Nitrospira sp.]
MSLLARVFLLILLFGIGTLQFFVNTEAGYAQTLSGSTKGDRQDPPKEKKCTMNIDCADKLGLPLMKYFVLSMFLEIVLTLVFKAEQVFTWLQGKTWKTPVAIGLGLLASWGLNLNIFQEVSGALNINPSWVSNETTKAYYSILSNGIDGILLAGGNHGLFRLFTRFRIHDPFDRLVRAAA